MKESTAEQRLAELLGLTGTVELTHVEEEKPKPRVKAKPEQGNNYAFYAVDESEIQTYRWVQGLLYYLRAPRLFHYLKCRQCHEPFMVSRKFIAFCSYHCLAKNCEKQGFAWSKGVADWEIIINEQFEGNEPIWIREPEIVLDALARMLELIDKSNAFDAKYEDTHSKLVQMLGPVSGPLAEFEEEYKEKIKNRKGT